MVNIVKNEQIKIRYEFKGFIFCLVATPFLIFGFIFNYDLLSIMAMIFYSISLYFYYMSFKLITSSKVGYSPPLLINYK